MKKVFLFLPLLVTVLFISCDKDNSIKDKLSDKDFDKEIDKDDDLELCTWDEATETSGESFTKYVVEELVVSEDCDCVVAGMEKFLENGKTKFLIYYKYEACEGYGYKVTCEDGDCEKGKKCKFLQDCDDN